MGDQSIQTRLSDWIQPMLNESSAGTSGQTKGVVLATSTTAAVVDLSKVPLLPAQADKNLLAQSPNVLGSYITLQAEGADCYVIFGQNAADVTGSNVPVPTNVNAVTAAGVPTLGLGGCMYIPAGQERSFMTHRGQEQAASGQAPGSVTYERFLAYVTKSGTGFLRVWGSSFRSGG
jgi:hypothetical protein